MTTPKTGQGGFQGVIYSCTKPRQSRRGGAEGQGHLWSSHRLRAEGQELCRGTGGRGSGHTDPQVTCRGVSSISMRKVSMGVSPISLKKKRCSRHFSPMERSAGRRRRSLANLGKTRVRATREALAALSHLSPNLQQPNPAPPKKMLQGHSQT